MQSSNSAYPYPLINDPTCLYPFFYAYPYPVSQLESITSQAKNNLDYPTHQNQPIFLRDYLTFWAQNSKNPNLNGPPPPFHLTLPLTQTHPLSNWPTYFQITQTPNAPSSRKIPTHPHSPSQFRLYSLARSRLPAPLPSPSSSPNLPYPSTPPPIPSPPPSSLTSTLPRRKGKSKITCTANDIPLAFLKKSRHTLNVSTKSLSSLEFAALSLTELQDSAPPKGTIQAFMANPLHGHYGHNLDALPQPVLPFAQDVYAASDLIAAPSIKIF